MSLVPWNPGSARTQPSAGSNHEVQIKCFHSENSIDLSVLSATKGASLFPCFLTWTSSSFLVALLVEIELFLYPRGLWSLLSQNSS